MDKEAVKNTLQSFQVADSNLDQILHKICRNKWEQEVIKSKSKPHSIGWVFAQAQDCYFVESDKNKNAVIYDKDGEEEPEPGRPDWYQTDKTRVKIKYRDIAFKSRAESASSKKTGFRKQKTNTFKDLQPKKRKSHLGGLSPRRQKQLIVNKVDGKNSTFEFGRADTRSMYDGVSKNSDSDAELFMDEPQSALVKNIEPVLLKGKHNSMKKESSASRLISDRRDSGEKKLSGSMLQFTIRVKKNLHDTESNKSGSTYLSINNKELDKRSRKTGARTKNAPHGDRVIPKAIPIPKTEQEKKALEEDERFYESTKDFRTQLLAKQIRQSRKMTLLAKKVTDYQPNELYRIEQSSDYMKPLNLEKIRGATLAQMQARVLSTVTRIPMKIGQKTVRDDNLTSSEMSFKVSSIDAKKNSLKIATPTNFTDMVIDENTNLLDVLADEFQQRGITETEDKNGFQQITGLDIRVATKQSNSQRTKVKDSYRGSLSAVKNMTVVPGVELREFKEAQVKNQQPAFVTVSGGIFRPQVAEDGSEVKPNRMSLDEYTKISGTHCYFPESKLSLERSQKLPKHSSKGLPQSPELKKSGYIRVISMNTTEEPRVVDSVKDSFQGSRLFHRKVLKDFAENKYHKGNVVINGGMLKADPHRATPARSALEQRQFVQRVMMDIMDEQTSSNSNRNKISRPLTRAHTVTQSMNSSMCKSSINPLKHNYAKNHDIQLNARLKKSNAYSLQDIDYVNGVAGLGSLHEAHLKQSFSRQKPAESQLYYNTESRINSTRLQSAAKTRANTSQKSSRGTTGRYSYLTRKREEAWNEQMVSGEGQIPTSSRRGPPPMISSSVSGHVKIQNKNNLFQTKK